MAAQTWIQTPDTWKDGSLLHTAGIVNHWVKGTSVSHEKHLCCLWDIQKLLFGALRCETLSREGQTPDTENLDAFVRECS